MADKTILAKDYRENPEIDYTQANQYERNLDLFKRTKHVLHPVTRTIYQYIRDICIDRVKNHIQYPKFIWKPKICDVGCGGGFGSNILSQEADFVWGIDVDENSVRWAHEVFTRHKNKYYYSPQLTFEVIDIKNEPREIQAFDIVACVEVIEHLDDYTKVLDFLKRLCKKNKKGAYLEPPDATLVYISTSNRNNPNVQNTNPKNRRHVREWTPGELYEILIKHFKYVILRGYKGEPVGLDTKEPIFFQCETPIL